MPILLFPLPYLFKEITLTQSIKKPLNIRDKLGKKYIPISIGKIEKIEDCDC